MNGMKTMNSHNEIRNGGSVMNIRPKVKLLTWWTCLALAQMAAGNALADSAIGVDTALGNAMNTMPNVARPQDADYPAGKRTPTGKFYDIPSAAPDEPNKTENGWEYFGRVEIGAFGGNANEQNAQFRTYKDLRNGLYLNNFSVQAERPDDGHYMEIVGGGVGRDDQYYGLRFGRYNDWRVTTFYNEPPHVLTSSYGSLWNGVGSANLTLKSPLTPGGSGSTATDNANVTAVHNQVATSLDILRKKGGLRYDVTLSDQWKAYASYTHEKREGARPFGAVWGSGNGTAPIEITEPIDYQTHDFLAGLQYVDPLNSFNLQLAASYFRNGIDTLTFQEPYRISASNGIAAGGFTQGRFDLAPNNETYKAKAEFSRALPNFYKGRFSAVVALGSSHQNDNLIPYSVTPGVTLTNVIGNNWDTTASLSRASAEARVDTKLIDLGLTANPTAALNLKGKFRFYETDNKTNPFLACNPNARYVDADPTKAGAQPGTITKDGCSGVWGRLINDGSGASAADVQLGQFALVTNGNSPLKSIPFAYKQYNAGLSGDYRLGRANSLNTAYERETFERQNRERSKTWEDRLKLTYANRAIEDSMLRLSYEYAVRRGDAYNPNQYGDFFGAALFPTPGSNAATWVHMLSAARKFDLADRNQHILTGRFNTMFRPDLDGGVSVQAKTADYPDSAYGRDRQNQNSINFDLNYQATVASQFYGFYSFQSGRTDQKAIASSGTCRIGAVTDFGVVTADNAAVICALPGSPLFPLINGWTADALDRNNVLGMGLRYSFSDSLFTLNITHARGRSDYSYDYTVGGAVLVAGAAAAGYSMPSIETRQSILEANLIVPLTPKVSLRLITRYENGRINDWHYQNLDAAPAAVLNNNLLPAAVVLDSGPRDYRATLLGVMAQIKM
ncbi:MAG: hypothetical protein D4S02_04450 [Rhodocyclaceae bacterium]|nr:MAG: hypothetical protein D4S02_04450 [Rhodocyclaceae bacterium]